MHVQRMCSTARTKEGQSTRVGNGGVTYESLQSPHPFDFFVNPMHPYDTRTERTYTLWRGININMSSMHIHTAVSNHIESSLKYKRRQECTCRVCAAHDAKRNVNQHMCGNSVVTYAVVLQSPHHIWWFYQPNTSVSTSSEERAVQIDGEVALTSIILQPY